MENGKSPSFLINTIKSLRRCSMAMWVYRSVIFFTIIYTPENSHVPWKGTISIGNTSSKHWFSGDMLVFQGVSTGGGFPTPIHLPTLPYEQPQPLATELTLASSRWPSKLSKTSKEDWIFTPWKTNMSPENQWLEDVFPIEIVPFQGTCWLFQKKHQLT